MLSLTALLALAQGAKAQEAYAVYDNDSKVATFYYDNLKASRENVGPINNSANYPIYRNATNAVFDPSFAAYRPVSAAYWFAYCNSLESIVGLQYLNTEDVTSMCSMFLGCRKLTNLDLSSFNTAKVTDMVTMFYNCNGLTTLNVSSFNTAKVTDMRQMFNGCSALTTLDLSNFNTENVTNMRFMFRYCSNLTSLNLSSSFNTRNVTDMFAMFVDCEKLTTLDLSSFDTRNVTTMAGMFENCNSLTTLDLSSFNTVNVTDMEGMFRYCYQLTSIDLSNFNTEKVTEMLGMFQGCSTLTTLDLSNFNTVNVTDMQGMFSDCYQLTSIDLSNFNTENVTEMGGMFLNCYQLTSLDLSSFNTRNVTSMNMMFYNDRELTTIYVSEGWTTDKVVGYTAPFGNNDKLVGGAGTSYTTMYETYYSDSELLIYARIDKTSTPGYLTYKAYDAPGPVVLAGNSDGAGNYWATYYNNVAGFVADENTTVYTAKVSDDKTKVVLTEVADRSVPLTYAVILKSTEEEMTLTYKKDITDVLPDNDLKGSGFDIDTPENTYMLAKGVKGVGFYHWTGSTIPAHRGYLTISGAAASRFLGFDDGTEDTTAIKGAQTEGIGDSPLYDLTGRRVEGQPQKGIYVKDGKKVFVK